MDREEDRPNCDADANDRAHELRALVNTEDIPPRLKVLAKKLEQALADARSRRKV